MSFVVPGLGHVYCGRIFSGIGFFFVIIVLVATGVGIVFALPLWAIGVYGGRIALRRNRMRTSSRMNYLTPLPAQTKVISVVTWYGKQEAGSFAKEVRRSYKNADSLERVSTTKLKWTLTAIDAYTDEHGEDADVAGARSAILRELHKRADR
jgi:hypothetical protein